jgi:transcriptional regulator with XRE-family HTH domain
MSLGQYIRELRDKRDISLREFAKKLECSAAFLSDIELGRRYPSDKILTDIATLLGVSVEELKARDVRAPLEELKRLTATDPRYAFAFRTVIEKKVSPEALLNLAKKAGKPPSDKK